uniref:tyrosine-type recombinase/integrase n=1 Tax=Clostridium tagluense TaxID=360422 RepID=UPI00384A6382
MKTIINELDTGLRERKLFALNWKDINLDNNLVFCNMFGNYLDSSNVLKFFKKLLNEMDLPDMKFHDLMHTYATRLFELGEDAKTVQETTRACKYRYYPRHLYPCIG